MRPIFLGSILALSATAAFAQTPPAQYSADAIKERLSGVTVAPATGATNPNCQTYEQRINDPKCAEALQNNEQLFPYRGGKPTTGTISATKPVAAVSGTIRRPVAAKPAAKPVARKGKATPATQTANAGAAAAASCVDQVGDRASGLNLCVTFARSSADLTPQARSNLDQFATALADPQLATLRFAIEGHADKQGNDATNKVLSGQRAAAVVAYLSSKGVSADRLSAEGFGSERPIAGKPPADPANRRVEARLLR